MLPETCIPIVPGQIFPEVPTHFAVTDRQAVDESITVIKITDEVLTCVFRSQLRLKAYTSRPKGRQIFVKTFNCFTAAAVVQTESNVFIGQTAGDGGADCSRGAND